MSSPHSIQLIIGLANPGNEYANTRHNAGAWFVEELADRENVSFKHENKYHGLHSQTRIDGETCHLLIPTTFMNRSGLSVQACMNYHKIPPNAILVAHDDLDLPVGTIKLKFDGGDGGHNGLKDIIRHLGTKQFYRLRIGIGRPAHSREVVDYVLKTPSKPDRLHIDQAIESAIYALPLILTGDMQKAMQQLHTTEK